MSRGLLAIWMGVMLLWPALIPVAAAQQAAAAAARDVTQLGGSTAFYRRSPLTTVASLRRMAGEPGMAHDIGTALRQAGLPDLADNVIAVLSAADTSVMGGECSDATPLDGVIVECLVRPGQALQWMAYRPDGSGDEGSEEPGLLRNIRWAGRQPFRAFLFRTTENDRTYTFVIPKVCGNLSLMGVQEIPRVAVAVPPALFAPPPPVAVAQAVPLPPPLAPSSMGSALSLQEPMPLAPVVRSVPFFIDVLVGKDRRVRPLDATGVGGADLAYAQCSPLLGLKIGIAKRFENDWELAGAVGLAISLVNADHKTNEHELFVDVEANKFLRGGVFVGTGLSLWDLAHSDTFTPAWMVHVGLPLTRNTRVPVHLLTEGRLFLDHADDIRNNYQFWGGVRVHF